MVTESLNLNRQCHRKSRQRGKKKKRGTPAYPSNYLMWREMSVSAVYCMGCLKFLKKKKKKALHLKHFILSLCSVPKLTLTDVLTLNRCLLWKNVVIWFCICQTHVLTFLPVKIPEIQLWLLKLSGGQYAGSKPVTTVFLESYQHFQEGKNHAMMFFYFVRGD